MTKYRTLRIPDEDFQRLRKMQRLLRQRGTDSINWDLLEEQDLVDVPRVRDDDDDDDDDSSDLTWGIILGLGAAALGYHLWKSAQDKERR